MFYGGNALCLLDLKNTHNEFWWETLNVNRNFVYNKTLQRSLKVWLRDIEGEALRDIEQEIVQNLNKLPQVMSLSSIGAEEQVWKLKKMWS